MPRLRPAYLEDADRLGAIHVAAWRDAYRGILEEEFLEGLKDAEQARWWANELAANNGSHGSVRTIVAVDDEGGVRGFARSVVVGALGELAQLYVEPASWGTGYGTMLHDAVLDRLANLRVKSAFCWVLPENERARRFYERAGWRLAGEVKREDVWGIDVELVRYRRELVRRATKPPREVFSLMWD